MGRGSLLSSHGQADDGPLDRDCHPISPGTPLAFRGRRRRTNGPKLAGPPDSAQRRYFVAVPGKAARPDDDARTCEDEFRLQGLVPADAERRLRDIDL